jgi:hypothetical protein
MAVKGINQIAINTWDMRARADSCSHVIEFCQPMKE